MARDAALPVNDRVTDRVSVAALGDAALVVTLHLATPDGDGRPIHLLARHIDDAVAGLPGWGRPIPAATSVLVPVDPLRPGVVAAARRLRALAAEALVAGPLVELEREGARDPTTEPDGLPPLEIPTRYGGADGPDLDEAADRLGLRPGDVVRLHAGRSYVCRFLGFAPGFGYLGTLADGLVLPRRAIPRPAVPAGSVAIAGPYTAVYPGVSPGGWHLIGRTSLEVWDPRRDPPALLTPGRVVRFVAEPGPR